MSTVLRVDREELVDAVDRMRRFEQQIQTALDEAASAVNRLHASWTGEAADGHRCVHTRWRRRTEEVHGTLSTMRRIATGAHENYSSAVAANVSMWRV